MKKRTIRILRMAAVVLILASLLWFLNTFCGNPVSRFLAVQGADLYLQSHFPDTDYQVVRVTYTFKTGDYFAVIESPSSPDTIFTLYFDMLGNCRYDTFDSVENRSTTARRLDMEYRTLTDQVFLDPKLPYDNSSIYSILFGKLEIYPSEAILDPNISDIPEYAISQEDLILDHPYDIRQLGAQAGHLVIYVDSEDITPEAAARIMLDFKARFDAAGIPFYAMDLTIRYPILEDGTREPGSFFVLDFPYREMEEKGLTDRIILANEAAVAYYASMDDK